MAQHDYVIDNQSFPATRTDINNVLLAISSTNSGTSAPSTTYASQLWYDTSANKLYIRNEDNDAWIPLFLLDQSNDKAGTLATEIDIEDVSGTNTAGTALTIKGGAGTGTGAGGAIIFQTADGGSSGSSVNAHATRVTITDDGIVQIANDLSITDKIIHTGDTNTALRFPAADTFTIETDGSERMRIDNSGAITATTTPAFLARPSSQQNNIANDNSVVSIAFGTEIYDQGSNFASNTFTAPVAGRYQFNVIVYLISADSGATYVQVRLDTSNRTYFGLLDFASTDLDLNFQTIAISVLADMDASDTAAVSIQQNAGTAQADISTDSAFSGFLAC